MHFRVGGSYAEDEKSREWRLRRIEALRLWGVVLREMQAWVQASNHCSTKSKQRKPMSRA